MPPRQRVPTGSAGLGPGAGTRGTSHRSCMWIEASRNMELKKHFVGWARQAGESQVLGRREMQARRSAHRWSRPTPAAVAAFCELVVYINYPAPFNGALSWLAHGGPGRLPTRAVGWVGKRDEASSKCGESWGKPLGGWVPKQSG